MRKLRLPKKGKPKAAAANNVPSQAKAAVIDSERTLAPANQPAASYHHADGQWVAIEEAVVGLAHRTRNLPCQDASLAIAKPRAALFLADGAGSSRVSEIGAQAVVKGLARLADTLDKPLAEILDVPQADENKMRTQALLFVKHAIGILSDLSTEHRRELRDFRSTLLLFITGKHHHLWLKVGDGMLVIEKQKDIKQINTQEVTREIELTTLGELGKGEFANQTQFLDSVTPPEVQSGYLPATHITGVALMSDGAAERLVANNGQQVAGRVASLLQCLREDKLLRSALTKMFYEDAFCQGSTGDDRAIALLACQPTPPFSKVEERMINEAEQETETTSEIIEPAISTTEMTQNNQRK